MGVDVVRIPDTIIIIFLTLSKGNTHFPAKSGIMVRQNENGESVHKKPFKAPEETCYRCEMEGHWSRTYRTTKHLIDLYQTSLKDKRKNVV